MLQRVEVRRWVADRDLDDNVDDLGHIVLIFAIARYETWIDEILGHLDFYKMGHHGSTNATPVSAVAVMGGNFPTMCSTQEDSFGSVANASEVPRLPLLAALAQKSRIVRSDQIDVNMPGNKVPAIPGASATLPTPDRGRFEKGPIYLDYFL